MLTMAHKGALRVLVIANDPMVIRVVSRLLGEIGVARTETAQDGVTALRLLQETEYQLAICELTMHPISGLELLKAVRANRRTEDLHFLVMAGAAELAQIKAGQQAGMDGCLLKPFTAS